MKRLILAILIFSSLNLFSQEISQNYQSIDHVKALNFDLFEEIGSVSYTHLTLPTKA